MSAARHGPDDRRSGAFPADRDGARRRGVPDRVARCRARLRPRGPSSSGRRDAPWTRAAISSARRRPFAVSGSLPSENSAKSRLATTYVLYRGPHSWMSDGIVPRRRLDPLDARVQREQRRPRHAVLEAGPRRPLQRRRPWRRSFLEPTDPAPERENLLPGELQFGGHSAMREAAGSRWVALLRSPTDYRRAIVIVVLTRVVCPTDQ